MNKRILVACGGAVATSSMIAEKLRELCREERIPVEIIQCRLSEIQSNLYGIDLIVTSAAVRKDFGVPLLIGRAFLSGIGVEKAKAEVLRILQ